MEELRNFNAKKLYQKLNLVDNEFEEWLKQLELIHRTRTCPECGTNMGFKWDQGKMNH